MSTTTQVKVTFSCDVISGNDISGIACYCPHKVIGRGESIARATENARKIAIEAGWLIWEEAPGRFVRARDVCHEHRRLFEEP
jgi:hypothetical protein